MRDTFQNKTIVTMMEAIKNNISMNPSSGDFSAKKQNDHKTFSDNCTKNQFIARDSRLPKGVLFQTKYKEMPINTNKSVQTGPKTQLGGLNDGLTNVPYQLFKPMAVNSVPNKPAP